MSQRSMRRRIHSSNSRWSDKTVRHCSSSALTGRNTAGMPPRERIMPVPVLACWRLAGMNGPPRATRRGSPTWCFGHLGRLQDGTEGDVDVRLKATVDLLELARLRPVKRINLTDNRVLLTDQRDRD